jgi:hypothetical protein
MLEVFAGKVRKTGFFQKAGFPGNSDNNFGIYSMLRGFHPIDWIAVALHFFH